MLAIAYITLNTATTTPNGSRGVRPGEALPPFAVPLATSALQGDANVATRGGQGPAGRIPACRVRGPAILNSCELAQRGPVVLALFVPAGVCPRLVDALDGLRASFPGVAFAAVAVRGSRDDVRALVRGHRWRVPVGHDRDGALANLYKLATCAQLTLALPGGRVQGSALLGVPTDVRVRARVQELVDAARAGGWRPA
ncbi:MAG TPA: hypothetical protein VGN69_11275 [Solirubrobacteraceae bacterium]|nr:hypothetical protein [Solirubrobacteraceae bacterium]